MKNCSQGISSGWVLFVIGIVELAAVVVVEEACRRKSNWVGLIGVKLPGLGKTLGICFGVAAVTEDLARRGTPLQAVERRIGGSDIVYSCDIAVHLWG